MLWRSPGLFALLLLPPALALAQADYAREQRWADEIVPAIVVGDALRLELKSGRKVLAIYTAAPKAAGAVVVVHGLGVHPDWGLIGALRGRLPELGYATLSVQMPVLAAGALAEEYPALFPEAAERLSAAVAHLKAKGFDKVALLSHSMGARMSNYFLTHAPDARVGVWVAVGLPVIAMEPNRLAIPVLDLHGEKDSPAVLGNVAARAATLRSIRGSAQVEVNGADHFFAGREDELARQVKIFLDRRLR